MHGLPADLEILSERWNTVVRLGDSSIIARATTLADLTRPNPEHAFRLEHTVCHQLADRGAPVQSPFGEVVEFDGIAVSLWHEIVGRMGAASEESMVQTLAQIHKAGKCICLEEPWFAIVADAVPNDLMALRDRGVLSRTDTVVLKSLFDRSIDQVVKANLPGGLVHGDAQRKNAMAVTGGAVWIDFEDCCVAPYAWDLACLTKNPNYDVTRVLDLYAEVSGLIRTPDDVMPALWTLRDLQALTWMLLIKSERDAEFAQSAQSLLQNILLAASAG